jgi:hypothetical protein
MCIMGIKAAAKRILPASIWAKLFKIRHEVLGAWMKREANTALLRKIGAPKSPLGGPFAAMRYISQATGSAYFPKLLGTYELEINDAIEWIVDWQPDVVVNVGCAEGYYAVGMARRCRTAQVVAFDIESRARRLVRRLAEMNHVADRIDIRRRCTGSNLQPICQRAAKPAVIVDCEGFEDHLLMPRNVPSLAKSVVLVEVHDCFVPGLSVRLRHRFAQTHECITFRPRPRRLDDLPAGVSLRDSDALEMMDEQRSESCWMLLIPLAAADSMPANLTLPLATELRKAV